MNEFYVAPLGGISLAPQLMDMGDKLREDRKAEADKQAKAARFAEVKSAMESAYQSGDPEQMAKVAMTYPEAQKTMESLAGFQSDKTKRQGIDTYRKVLSYSNDPQSAISALQSRVDFLTESGADPRHTMADLTELKGLVESGQDATPFFKQAEMAFAGLAPDEYKALKGVDSGGVPASVKETEWFLSMPPEVQEQHLKLKRQENPSLAAKLQYELDKEEGIIRAQTEGATDKKFKEQLGAQGAKVYTDLQQAAQQASAFIPRLKSLRELSSRVDTGTGAEIKLAAKKALGIDSADMEELNAKLGELAQDILNQQTGTKTDFDFQNAVKQAASLGKTKEANKRLIDALIDRQLEAVSFGDMAKDAYDKNGVKGVLDMRFSPTEQAREGQGMSAIDKQALEWANNNPSDPRSASIKQRLGK